MVATAALLLLMRFYKKPGIFKLMEAVVILMATGYVLFSILSTALPTVNLNYLLAFAAIATGILIIAKNIRPGLRNFLAVSSSIGVGILIGSNGFYLAYFLMLLITVYDWEYAFLDKTIDEWIRRFALFFVLGNVLL